jgi:hypothetical protein
MYKQRSDLAALAGREYQYRGTFEIVTRAPLVLFAQSARMAVRVEGLRKRGRRFHKKKDPGHAFNSSISSYLYYLIPASHSRIKRVLRVAR